MKIEATDGRGKRLIDLDKEEVRLPAQDQVQRLVSLLVTKKVLTAADAVNILYGITDSAAVQR
jgi:hypothetical protein